MRVALLCPYSLSKPGGVQGQVLGLARALRAGGHEAAVLAPVDGDVELDGLPADALIRLGRSLPVPSNGSVAPIALGPGPAVRAVHEVRRGRFDVLHMHEPLAPGPSYACLVACREPKVGTFHRAGPSAAYRLLAPLARWGAGRLAARCAVSDEARATAAHALGGTYDVIGNGVELERFSSAPPWQTRVPTALFVGRHEERKGLEVLLTATTRVDPDMPFQLWVVGEGPETARLRRRFPPSSRVTWLGRVDDDELAARLAGADVLCAPSLRGESFGVVLLEAMAARACVVASDLPGYRSVVAGHGLLVPPGDPAAWAAALGTVLADASRGAGRCAVDALDAAARHAEQWDMRTVAARYVEVYDRVRPQNRTA
ncbi:MAG TPA: glycosyltransferase family 4 protein [Acidimicrobiales bacterium]|nr:glycosyltransferase family 4 protein [Acidimicrobiales bacterium]